MAILGAMTAPDDTQEHPVVRAEAPSLEALYSAHAARLARVLRAAGYPDASDAVQEAFVQAVVHWRKISRYDDPGAWIRPVAINRGHNRRPSRQPPDPPTQPTPDNTPPTPLAPVKGHEQTAPLGS